MLIKQEMFVEDQVKQDVSKVTLPKKLVIIDESKAGLGSKEPKKKKNRNGKLNANKKDNLHLPLTHLENHVIIADLPDT